MTQWSSLNRKEMIKEGFLNVEKEERITEGGKIWVNSVSFSFPLEFSKLSLKVEAKTIILSDVVLNVCKRNIYDNYIMNGRG